MIAQSTSATPWGIDARAVQIEVDVHFGLPQVQIVGLPDTAVRESRERVRAAIKNCGFDLPPRSVIVNLAPADLRKEGNHLDLGIATALVGRASAYDRVRDRVSRTIGEDLPNAGAARSAEAAYRAIFVPGMTHIDPISADGDNPDNPVPGALLGFATGATRGTVTPTE